MDTETVDQLRDRIEPDLEKIDLDTELSKHVLATIAFAELSGSTVSDWAKRIMVLEERNILTPDQCEQLMLAKHTSR